MLTVENRRVAEIARELGHASVQLESTGRGNTWQTSCSCGWHSKGYALPDTAVVQAQAHLRKVARGYVEKIRRDGRVSPHNGQIAL